MGKCPVELIRRAEVNSAASISSGVSTEVSGSKQLQTDSDYRTCGKRNRDGLSYEEPRAKKQRGSDETANFWPRQDKQPCPPYGSGSNDNSNLSERSVQVGELPGSALELAQQAAEAVWNEPKHSRKAGKHNDSTAKTTVEQLQNERDEAITERDAAVDSCRALKRELRHLKRSIKEKEKRTKMVLGLVTASLQGLQASSEEKETDDLA
ncbi:hypothetical protein FRC07_007348 [Ceratobasidium sp. 392]|nr:hypothetical protein FRC07_007348 [Ceratobasidium sp. 392]